MMICVYVCVCVFCEQECVVSRQRAPTGEHLMQSIKGYKEEEDGFTETELTQIYQRLHRR